LCKLKAIYLASKSQESESQKRAGFPPASGIETFSYTSPHQLAICIALLLLYPRFPTLSTIVEQLLYLTLLLDINMSFQNAPKKFDPARAKQNPPQAPITSAQDALRAQKRMLGSQAYSTLNPNNKKTFDNLVGEKRTVAFKHDVLGNIAAKVCNVKRRGDYTLAEGAHIATMVVEGLPSEYGTSPTVAMLQKIDPNLDSMSLAANLRISDPPLHKNGEPAATKQATLTNITISAALANFIANGTQDTSFPVEVYLSDKSADTHAVEIIRTDELHSYLQILESAACNRRQIEAMLLQSVEDKLMQTAMNTSVHPVAVRISTTRMEGQSAAGKHTHTLRRIPCSDGKILLILRDASSVDTLMSSRARVGLGFELEPLTRIPLIIQLWQSAAMAELNREYRSTIKEAEARSLAASTTPNLSAITKIEAQLSTESTPGARLHQLPLVEVEKALVHALGGIEVGVLAAQLQADANSKVNINGPCTIWVGDIERTDKRLSKALVDRLASGAAASHCDRFEKIKSRGRPRLTPVCEPTTGALAAEEVATIILHSLPEHRQSYLMLRETLTNGQPLPFEGSNGSATPLSDLGEHLHSNDGHVDIRCLFPTTGFSMDRLPTVETLCSAVAKLAAEGVVSIYNISLDSTPVLVLRPAVYDDWNAAAAEMRTD